MKAEQQIQEFQRRAHEAENLAAAVSDPMIRGQWLQIAKGYRELAQARLGLPLAVASDRPSPIQDSPSKG